jgi:chromosome segregation protein
MRIKRLDITGFKSFMERVVFSFDDGITGVVGPNGCGKSNVVDAIRWAMGEQSAKNLRGRGMEDVIFNGSETHAALSMAEVTLTFSVGPQDALPTTLAGLPEVSVTRRLFRSGESEYQINKTTCRLLDVTELFLGTGVGTRAYSIIEQGRVGQIVSARPEDRRSFIEEAAGITRYKARRKAAERKLEYTRVNLQRVNDIVAELDRRLAALERQAKRAEKHQRLRLEIRELELAIFAHRFQGLSAVRQRVSGELEQLVQTEREAAASALAQEAALAARREALASGSAALEARSQELHALESQAQLEAQSVLHLSDDQAAAQERLVAVAAELEELAARRAALEQEQAPADAELAGLAVSNREDEVLLQVKTEEHRRALALQAEIVRRLEDERSQVVALATRIAGHLGTLATLEQRSADAEARGQQLDQEVAQLRAEEAQLEAARREVLDRVEQHRLVTLELTERRGAEEGALKRVREAFAENEVMVIALREDLADKKSRLNSLEEIARNYEGYDRGVRAVMAQVGAEPRKAGVFGVVSDVISAPPELEKAIEAALGERLQHIVVETPERGYELVAHLKALAEGRSTFVPVPAAGGGARGDEPLVPQALGLAMDRVAIADPVLRPVVETLLAGVVLVADLEAARAAASLRPDGVYVTLDGEVVRPGGVVTGGALEGPAIGALHKKRQIAELSAQVGHLEERYNELITRHYELQKQLGHSEGVLKGLERNRHQEELSLTGHEKDLHQAGSSLARLRERVVQLGQERQQVEDARRTFAYEAESARGEAAHGQADRALREERVRLMGSELESLQGRLEQLQAEVTALKVKVASVAERGEAARMRVESLTAQGSELAMRAHARERARLEDQERLATLEERLLASAQGLPQRVEALEQARRGVEAQREAHGSLTLTVAEDERALKEVRTQLEALATSRAAAAIKDRELELELEHLSTQVQERHQLSMPEALVLRQHAPAPSETAAEALEELKRAVERLGEVNLTAIEEHRELSERHTFLSGQQRDLTESLERLTQAIEKIDVTSRARFKETFDIVNDKFQQVFPRLFGGGRASLMLVPGTGGEEPGVEILAQPPGKKLQSVNLFSGGEKALTAVALIFAIFLIKPTPFCLLDEVDAPLDEGNVGRYNEMVREMSQGSQFILITHNKRTMEVVDALYGVTMEEPGVSKLVSVKLKDATAANGDQQVA